MTASLHSAGPALTALTQELERAHRQGVGAAAAGLSDAALGALRLSGTAVPVLAEAAVSSATPFLRAPLLGRISAVQVLHPRDGTSLNGGTEAPATCPTCAVPAPCDTAKVLS